MKSKRDVAFGLIAYFILVNIAFELLLVDTVFVELSGFGCFFNAAFIAFRCVKFGLLHP